MQERGVSTIVSVIFNQDAQSNARPGSKLTAAGDGGGDISSVADVVSGSEEKA